MCGRFSNTGNEELLAARFGFKAKGVEFEPRYNQAPGQDAAVVTGHGERSLGFMRWGLVPAWAKDKAKFVGLINARAESLADKLSFRSAYRRRRCLVLADGYYEWQKGSSGKRLPWRFTTTEGAPFAMAGLWEPGAEDHAPATFTIVTTQANDLVAKVHQRMPVILAREAEALWLDSGLDDPQALDHLLAPYPAGEMASFRVSSKINNAANQGPELIEPVSEPSQGELGF